MSMDEKYGSFSISDILFYDEKEQEQFLAEFNKTYHNFISKVNGKRVIGKSFFPRYTKEEKSYLGLLEMHVKINDEQHVMNIKGYGHRRTIVPLEMKIRELFDEGKIVSYNAEDTLIRSVEPDNAATDDILELQREMKRRLELYQKGELEPPKYRQGEGIAK